MWVVLVLVLLLLMWPKIVGVCGNSIVGVCGNSIDVGVDGSVGDGGGVSVNVDVGVGVGRWCPCMSGVCHSVSEEIVDVGVRVFVGV